MVQPAESRKGLNLAFSLRANCCRPTCWRVLGEPEMSPVLMVVEQVERHQSFEMPLIQDDHVVQQIASATSRPTFSNTVLPRTAKGRARWLGLAMVSEERQPSLHRIWISESGSLGARRILRPNQQSRLLRPPNPMNRRTKPGRISPGEDGRRKNPLRAWRFAVTLAGYA